MIMINKQWVQAEHAHAMHMHMRNSFVVLRTRGQTWSGSGMAAGRASDWQCKRCVKMLHAVGMFDMLRSRGAAAVLTRCAD